MTGRLPWAGDPRPLWKAWDEFGIAGSRMIGCWVRRESREDRARRTCWRRATSARRQDAWSRPGELGEGARRRPAGDRLEEARPRSEKGPAERPGHRQVPGRRRNSSRATPSASSPARG
ncbi:MAG: DUF6067 family protein [Sphingobacterium sp.]|nr:DUF6067 family protein [Sphingobacterium sp.]